MYLGFRGDVSMSIPITAINSKGAILEYWLKCTCCCQTRVLAASGDASARSRRDNERAAIAVARASGRPCRARHGGR